MGSALLKIDDEKELKFIQSQISYVSWIGLSRKGNSRSWTWEDASQPFHKMLHGWQESKSGNCARMTAMKMAAFECFKVSQYICEK
ncbi:C-type lectin domain family 9 member A-like [Myotis yumanensis]|uniref:C-type lectin domain family 9 member A-like n=1 Tax=Myotis yumanensis TaxID=159337 RepID=UPI0038D1BAED